MRYIIRRYYIDYPDTYIHRDFPTIKWTDDINLALRMHPERAAKISYQLMNMGISHSIIQHTENQ